MDFEKYVKDELNGAVKKVNCNMTLYTDGIPHVAPKLKYSTGLTADGNWTGGFWFGMIILSAIVSGDFEKYIPYLNSFKGTFRKRVRSGYKDHDLGFLYQLYAIDGYRLTNDIEYLELADLAARCLYARFNTRGGFIRAWNLPVLPWRQGKTIIDCMMNLPLLFCDAKAGGDSRYYNAAYRHAKAALHNIRPDGTVYHTYDFDPVTGKPLKGENEGGYADESCWSRGLAWAIYGFYLAWVHTGEKEFLEVSQKTADCFMENVKPGEMPLWDFRLEDRNDRRIDTSAAAIAVCAMYQLSEAVGDGKYYDFADLMLGELMTKHSHASDMESECLLDDCMCAQMVDGERKICQWGTIWGDYFYMEALTMRSGLKVRMWDM